ncbi:MAG: hypothetical protein ABR562_06195 [Thermoplasmatota archaeon]
MPWIWLGGVLMALGGLVSLSDRRHRVGAPARRRHELAAAVPQAATARPASRTRKCQRCGSARWRSGHRRASRRR